MLSWVIALLAYLVPAAVPYTVGVIFLLLLTYLMVCFYWQEVQLALLTELFISFNDSFSRLVVIIILGVTILATLICLLLRTREMIWVSIMLNAASTITAKYPSIILLPFLYYIGIVFSTVLFLFQDFSFNSAPTDYFY